MHAAVLHFRLTTGVTGLNLFARPLKLEHWQSPTVVYPYSTALSYPVTHPMRVLVVQVGHVQPLIIC